AAIVILAAVAVLVARRLHSVLGERTGREQPILKPADPEAAERIEPRVATRAASAVIPSEPDDLAYLPTAGPGIRSLLAADSSFDVARFLEGSKAAYRLILAAFWKGDLAAMKPFV